jgi:ubiquinone/menaquinone biosynthesis C-methylase UbiE/uncharacterized protein YbaR (Trm112 family)
VALAPTEARASVFCPQCAAELEWMSRQAQCRQCGGTYRVDNGIPVLLPAGAIDEGKRAQARHFDADDSAEFEIGRPHGTPRLYQWYYEQKFQRSISHLRSMLEGTTALVICGGSGMDADFLARSGCRVVTSDISLGASKRARERARRHGLSITPVVADAERLPFRDRSFDLVYVHDGLHHLEQPQKALSEMTRVARRAVSLTEPADAAATKVAVRIGAALEREEAGNRVIRFRLQDLTAELQSQGFRVVEADRYAMYYRHEPGKFLALLSRRPLFGLTTAGIDTFNKIAGGIGNRLTVQAVRVADD